MGARWGRRTAAAVVLLAVMTTSGCLWSQPGAGPGRTFHNAAEAQLTSANVATLTEAWAGRGRVSAVVGGVAIAATSGTTTEVVAYDVRTGAELWAHALNPAGTTGAHSHPPVVVGDEVWAGYYARTSPTTCANALVRLDLATGALVAQDTSFAPVELVPATGRVVLETSSFLPTAPTGQECIGYGPGEGRVVEAATGATIWTSPLGFAEAIVVGDSLFTVVGSELARYAVAGCGAPVCPSTYRSGPAQPGTLYDLAGGSRGPLMATAPSGAAMRLLAVDPSSGSLVGSAVTPFVPSALALADGVAYVAGDENLAAYDVSSCADGTCDVLWTTSVGGEVTWADALAVAGRVVYVGRQDGVVEAYPAAGCSGSPCPPITQVATGGAVLSLAVADGRLFVASSNEVTAFAPTS